MTYNEQGKRITSENLAGQVTTTAWDCCHKTHEIQPDGSTTTWDYDDDGRLVETSRLIPLDLTNQTWVSICYRYDDLGRQIATWQTNATMHVGLPEIRTAYDPIGRVTNRVDVLGNDTITTYSPNGLTIFVQNPNTSTRVTTRSADGDTISITGTGVTPEFHTYGISPDGTRWSRTVQGETANSPRFTKRYENLLGQTVRKERSGFQGAVLATVHNYDAYGRLVCTSADYEPTVEYTYDDLGNRIATTRTVGRAILGAPQSDATEWRKTETLSSFVLDDAVVWLTQTNIVSCSDSSIAPLATSSARQLTSLAPALPSRSRSTDVRGNVTENETLINSSFVTSRQTVPYATNKPLSISRYGVSLMDVSVSAVTNSVAYDSLGRQIANTDGRGNTRHTEYNSVGQRSASIDALGNCTAYAYDQFGNLASVTDPLGNATVYEYDLRGRKTYEGGATYPVRYAYDVFGNKTTMMTYRNESLGPDSGDVTTWLYDAASNCLTNKIYADGKGSIYSYTPYGKLAQRIWARGITSDYSYDGWNNLTNTVYSDGTPTVSVEYNALGRQTGVNDAAGLTSFLYDSFGSLTNETVVGVAGTNTIERFYDNYDRDIGYAITGIRQSTLAYDPATGRLETMQVPSEQSNNPNNQAIKQFTWNYLAGSDLKSSLSYPNGLTASWQYDANSQLLQVCNALPTNVISQYDYTYNPNRRRITCTHLGSAFPQAETISFDYNTRSELTNAVADVNYGYTYQFDDNGNRKFVNELGRDIVFEVNQLNQYLAIDGLSSAFDDDGNQTIVKTETGNWRITYNGENRPVQWSNGSTNITMKFDSIGRRVEYIEVVDHANGSIVTNTHHRFVYNGYLCLERLDATDNNEIDLIFSWDPTEKKATRPLMIEKFNVSKLYVVHDGNKNVSELISFAKDPSVVAHYEYAPFGELTSSPLNSGATPCDFRSCNPFRFSSEYFDDPLGMLYYIYRHYMPHWGVWLSRDNLEDTRGRQFMLFCDNDPINNNDYLGLWFSPPIVHPQFGFDLQPATPKPCSCGEEVAQLFAVGPIDAIVAKSLAEEASALAVRLSTFLGGGLHNGPADAFRHCYWSCRMAQELGADQAEKVGNVHEQCNKGPQGEIAMDLANNRAGRSVNDGTDCLTHCLGLLRAGELQTRPGGSAPTSISPLY